jgi:hypothetical protein
MQIFVVWGLCGSFCLMGGCVSLGAMPKKDSMCRVSSAVLEEAAETLEKARELEAQADEAARRADEREAESAALALKEVSSCVVGASPFLKRR